MIEFVSLLLATYYFYLRFTSEFNLRNDIRLVLLPLFIVILNIVSKHYIVTIIYFIILIIETQQYTKMNNKNNFNY
jgi:hypothetical protein